MPALPMKPSEQAFEPLLEYRPHLERIAAFASRQGIRVYLVGGLVRDIFLGFEAHDLDLVWVGAQEARRMAEGLARAFGVGCDFHPEFLTARLGEVPDDTRERNLYIDFARARKETYPAPAALPRVEPACLEEDLARRDFSVNAMAVELTNWSPGRRFRLIDPQRGFLDLEARRLRILHPHSFEDDPTRILRGVDLAVRRGLEFEQETRRRAEEAISAGLFDKLSGVRVQNELRRCFRTVKQAARCADLMSRFGLDRALTGKAWRPDGLERLELLAGANLGHVGADGTWILSLTALEWGSDRAQRNHLADHLGLSRSNRDVLVGVPERVEGVLEAAQAIDLPAEVLAVRVIDLSLTEQTLTSALANDESVENRLQEALTVAGMRLTISGTDLLDQGHPPGARVGAALAATLAARWRREIGAAEELAYASHWLNRHYGSNSE